MAIIFRLIIVITNIIITIIHRLTILIIRLLFLLQTTPTSPTTTNSKSSTTVSIASILSILSIYPSIYLPYLSILSIYPLYISILSIYPICLSIYRIYPLSLYVTAWCFVSGRETAHHATFCVTDVTINALSPLGTIFHIWRRLHGVYRGCVKTGFFSF